FFLQHTATPPSTPLSLHDALPICRDLHLPAGIALPDLRRHGHPEEDRIDGLRDVVVERDALVRLDLDEHLERGRRLALEDALLRPAAARLFVGKGDRLDAADEIRERWVQHEVLERVAVRRRDELN